MHIGVRESYLMAATRIPSLNDVYNQKERLYYEELQRRGSASEEFLPSMASSGKPGQEQVRNAYRIVYGSCIN